MCDINCVNSFYELHPDDELLPNGAVNIKKKVTFLMFIPTVWVPWFINGLLSPNNPAHDEHAINMGHHASYKLLVSV
jgi:hypothetical protein